MRHKILFGLLFFLSNYSSFSQDIVDSKPDWVVIGSDGQEAKYYVKSEYVKKDEEGIKIWTRTIFKKQAVGKIVYNNLDYKVLMVINCEEKQLKVISAVYYTSSGELIKSYNIEEYLQKWEDAVPGSVGERIINYVCDNYNY